MLKAYIRKLRNAFLSQPASREWVANAFRDFTAVGGNRADMLASIEAHARQLARALHRWLDGDDSGKELAESLAKACKQIDDGKIWHTELTLRSYVDISIEVKALRNFVDYLSMLSEPTMPTEPLEITALLIEHDPNSRAALLVHADLLLEDGDTEVAIDTIQRALRIQAVCTTAQEMLFRAYRLVREQGSTAPELNVLDYDLTDKFCPLPFTHMSTGYEGTTYPCACPAWVPFSIGNILEAGSADEIWNSDAAAEIRRSILDGDFRYCSRTLCSFITAQKLPKKSEITKPAQRGYIENHTTRISELPEMVELNHDPTCNLACPSCRTEIVAAKSEDVDLYAQATERVILPLLKKIEGHTYITGGGEAFASKHFRSILHALNREEYPGLNVYLITNGQLITPQRWSAFPNLPEMVAVLSVSVDAACAETYETLRRPGKWIPLMKNLAFIGELRRSGRIRHFCMNFVVQRDNFREMLDFVVLADDMGADRIWFQRVTNYGAYDEPTFAKINVTSPAHPDHAELLSILRNPVLKRPTINTQMLLSLLPEFVASDERIDFPY